MEDELAVERLLLLKHVVRAASVRHAQTQEHLTPAEKYYNFFPNSLSIDATDWSIEKCRQKNTAGNVVELPQKLDGRGMHPQISLAPSLHFLEARASLTASGKHDAGGHRIHDRSVTNQSHVREKNRGHSLSFSADISGFSLALCDFVNVKTTEVEAHYAGVDQYSHDAGKLTLFNRRNLTALFLWVESLFRILHNRFYSAWEIFLVKAMHLIIQLGFQVNVRV